jgi:hypothetical protein
MSKMYDNLISTAINSINIVENTVIITYNSNKDKEYTFECKNVEEFTDSLNKELLGVDMKNEEASIGKFIHYQIKEGVLVETK